MTDCRRIAAALLLLAGAPLASFADGGGPFTSAGPLQGVRLSAVASGLGPVTSVVRGQGSTLFLGLRDGRVVVREGAAVRPQPFLDVRGLVSLSDEGGLLSLAFHPRYAENGFFFVEYTNLTGDAVVARYKASASDPFRADPASARRLLTISQPFRSHNGGQLQFGPDGYLYISSGDGGAAFDPSCLAQKPDNLLGKILRIDVDQNVTTPPYYGIPATNPFHRGPGAPPDEVWATGLRNPWRFSFDRLTGDLWIGDVGQNHREEVDFQPASSRGGENYGWKVMEGTLCSTTDSCPATTPVCGATAYTPPVLEYDHDPLCAVTGGTVYRGSRLPGLQGAYLFGDFCTGTIWAAFREGTGFKVYTLVDRAPQLAAFGEDASGELYLGTLTGDLFTLAGGLAGSPVDTVGLYDPSASRFQLKQANTTAASTTLVRFGSPRNGWVPLSGDWNGDGKRTPGFWAGASSTFRLKNSLQGGAADVVLKVDSPSASVRPVVGDWDGDGKDTVGLYDVATGAFRLKNTFSGPGFDLTVQLGSPGQDWLPFAADWDGDGVDTAGLFDPVGSTFLSIRLGPGGPGGIPLPFSFQFGQPGRGALPVAGDWNGDGRDGVGLYEPALGVFRLKNLPLAGTPDLVVRFGPRGAGWKPLAGVW
jgi:glucose/arabinose dehydrogenase